LATAPQGKIFVQTFERMPSPSPVWSVLSPLKTIGGEPLHRQVETRLRQLAALPEFQGGALLPDELTMANRLGVSRGTARAALTRLVYDGLLERKAGIGTKVARPRGESGIRAWRSFSREMAAKGITVQNFRTELRTFAATPAAARALRVPTGSPVPRLDRVRGWRGRPVLLSRSWLHPRLGLKGTEDFSRPLYDLLEQEAGAVAESAQEDFTAVAASVAFGKQLRVRPGTPLLLRCHTVADASGRPIEYAQVLYVSSRFTLTLDLRREPA
jgi:GntR family transcriptional regulator